MKTLKRSKMKSTRVYSKLKLHSLGNIVKSSMNEVTSGSIVAEAILVVGVARDGLIFSVPLPVLQLRERVGVGAEMSEGTLIQGLHVPAHFGLPLRAPLVPPNHPQPMHLGNLAAVACRSLHCDFFAVEHSAYGCVKIFLIRLEKIRLAHTRLF